MLIYSFSFLVRKVSKIYAEGEIDVCVDKDMLVVKQGNAVHVVWRDTIAPNPTSSDPIEIQLIEECIQFIKEPSILDYILIQKGIMRFSPSLDPFRIEIPFIDNTSLMYHFDKSNLFPEI